MPAAHIAGIPIEETLLFFGGPTAIYLAMMGLLAALRQARSRLGSLARRTMGVSR